MGCFAASKDSNCHVWIPEELLRGVGPKKKGAKIGDEADRYLDINKAELAPSSTIVEVQDRERRRQSSEGGSSKLSKHRNHLQACGVHAA